MTKIYDFKKIERKWRPYWKGIDLYQTGNDPDKPKYYILDFFPYPSGDGLSVGHCRNYVPTCVAARYKRMNGYNVLHPMGWDAFGLPAENYAIKHKIHPRITSKQHADTYRRQMKLVECSYDWSRELSSTDPDYYRWTQWFFLLLYREGLAYQAVGKQWWCPIDKTILANEQVINGRCWRCGTPVTKKDLRQWYFRITDYADRLLSDMDTIDWPESIKLMQRNWIGRSAGAEITFRTKTSGGSSESEIKCFTTRPDTLFGVTFLALSPENPQVLDLTIEDRKVEVTAYIKESYAKSEIDRSAEAQTKSGAFTGSYAMHPLTGEEIPIWVADYVLMEYGSGSVMGVPGHDDRDYIFAQSHGLPVFQVVAAETTNAVGEQPYTGIGKMLNSGKYSGLSSAAGGAKIVEDLAKKGLAQTRVTYKMRDWLISRQRYWGAPIPIIHCRRCGTIPVPEEDLPVLLPDISDFDPTGDGRSPLAKVEDWVNTTCPQCEGPAARETDTMDGFACSSWYFLRFASPHYDQSPFEPEVVDYWLPVDTYVGGAEHAVMHLLYSRFWTKVMFDAGLISFDEPFTQLRNQGVLHAADGQRMSKSRGNVVTPDEVAAQYGMDALRAYILFIGPFDGDVIWDDANIKGIERFLDRYWNLAQDFADNNLGGQGSSRFESVKSDFGRQLHKLIKKVTYDFEEYKFNTAIAAMMAHLNYLISQRNSAVSREIWQEALETFTILLCPIIPFMTEEIWQEILDHKGHSVHRQKWPSYDDELLKGEEVKIMIQVNGKLRDKVVVPAGVNEEDLKTAALERANVQRHIVGKPVVRIIVVPDRLINIVTIN